MKRYLVFPLHFDTRANSLDEVGEHWEDQVKELHLKSKETLLGSLRSELGVSNFEQKVENFKELGSLPFSIVAHHNGLFHQARYAFIHGLYYPALTASCALGERILNHLLLDLRVNFPQSSFDRKSHTRRSIDDWSKAIRTLNEWGVFQEQEVVASFERLKLLRHHSLHFNPSTSHTQREDALLALRCLATIIDKQFGFLFGRTIPGSRGAFFLKKDAEADPFVRHYYLHQCAFVSPYYAMRIVADTWLVFDWIDRREEDICDEQFVSRYEERSSDQLAPTDIPWSNDVSVVALTTEGVKSARYQPD